MTKATITPPKIFAVSPFRRRFSRVLCALRAAAAPYAAEQDYYATPIIATSHVATRCLRKYARPNTAVSMSRYMMLPCALATAFAADIDMLPPHAR